MISRWLLLALPIVLLCPGVLRAQTAPAYPGPKFPDAFQSSSAASTNYGKMYEDIEIMRRILGSKLQPLYPRVSLPNLESNPFTNTFVAPNAYNLSSPQNTMNGANFFSNHLPLLAEPKTFIFASPPYKEETLPSLEGVYLKDQGVVYTATLSSLQPYEKAGADSALRALADSSFNDWTIGLTVRQESEWENIRRQVRNEKDKPKKAEESKPPTLSDVLLKVLAENGHNFSQLGENESLTIVLTVHKTNSPSPRQKSPAGAANRESKPATSDSNSGLRDKVRDLELLVELHLKQGKHEDALPELHKALELTTSPKQRAELLRKLAQCYLMQGQDDKARATLDQVLALMKKESEAKANPAPATKPASALPVKLIISAPKKLLDQVKEGKITFEEFRRQSRVETLRFDERR